MRISLTDWRFSRGWCALLTFVLAAVPINGRAQEAGGRGGGQADAAVDPASKKLLAANALFGRGLFKLAAQEYAEFLSQYPNHGQRTAARYGLAVCAYRQADYATAATVLREVLKDGAFGQRAEALAVLGQCELAGKRYAEAVAAFDELIEKYAKSPHAEVAALNRAQALYLLGKYEKAADACGKFALAYPGSGQRATATYFQALSLRASGKWEETIASVDRLAGQDPQGRYAADAALLKGQALESLGKLDEAIEQYRRMAAASPEERKGDANYALGSALYKAGKYDQAAAALAGVTGGAYAKPARLQLGLAQLATGRTAEARTTLDAVVAGDPERAASARYALARCDMAEKKYDAARQTLGELLRGTPAPANAFQIRLDGAVCLMELGKFDQAAVELESLSADRSAGDRLGETLYRLAFSLHKTSKYEASHAACARLAAASGVSAEFSRAAAELDAENLFLLGKYGDAAPAFERLAKDARDERRGLQWRLRIGQCAYFGGDYARAVALLTPLAEDQRASAAPELQGAIFLLGDALLQQGKEREAAAALARYVGLAKEGNLAEAKYKLGLARLRSGDKQGAEKTLADLVSGADDRSAWVQRGLLEYGQILQKAGKLNEAEAALRRVIEAKAPVELAAPATYVLGWVAFDAKQYAQAAERWGQVAEKYSSHALAEDAAFRRGIALKEAGQAEQAAKALQGFADAHPQSSNAVQARQMAAACLAAEGKNDQATAVLASLAMSPKAGDSVLYDLAWAQRGQKNDGAAAETYARLLKEHPESKLGPAVRVELAEILYGQKAYEGATELLEAAMKADRVDAKLRANAAYRLGWCYQKLGKAAKAAEAFGSVDAKATGSDEIAASAVLQAGLAYADAGRFDQSEAALTRFVKEYSTNGQVGVAMLKLGEVQAEEGKYAESAGTFAAFLQKDPKDPFACRAHFGIGWALENQKKYEEARASYQRAIASTNGETAARAQFQVGETYLYERKFDQAIPALLAVEDVYAYPTWSARALLEAGRAFEELKQADQAKKQYEQLISKYKDAPEAGAARDRLAALARH